MRREKAPSRDHSYGMKELLRKLFTPFALRQSDLDPDSPNYDRAAAREAWMHPMHPPPQERAATARRKHSSAAKLHEPDLGQ